METYRQSPNYPRSIEQWLRRRDEVIDGIGMLTVATFSAGLLEAGSPSVETSSTALRPESQRVLAASSLALLGVERPSPAAVYTDEALLGHAA